MGGVTHPLASAHPSAAIDDDIVLARAYLSRVAEPASLALWEFVGAHGPVEAARRIRAGAVPEPIAA